MIAPPVRNAPIAVPVAPKSSGRAPKSSVETPAKIPIPPPIIAPTPDSFEILRCRKGDSLLEKEACCRA